MRMLSFVFALLVLVLSGTSELIAGEAALDKTALEKLNDDSIKAAVQGKLAADNIQDMDVVAFAHVDVQADRGTVVLSGVVQTAAQKARAEQLAGEVNGVKGVTNNLKVQTVKQR